MAVALSPSRLNTLVTCPLKYRLESVDRIPQEPTAAMTKGTLVHAVLEDLFDLPAGERDNDHAQQLLGPAWQKMKQRDPDLADAIFDTPNAEAAFIDDSSTLISQYFSLENPVRLAPAFREKYVHVTTPEGIALHGFIDRVDIAPDGQVRIIDYKTGKIPRPQYMGPLNFQLEFYALMWKLHTGDIPRRLQLLFLRPGQNYTHDPVEADLHRAHDTIATLWDQIKGYLVKRDFPARKNPLCNWCDFKELCPAWGGTLPPFPDKGAARLSQVQDGFDLPY